MELDCNSWERDKNEFRNIHPDDFSCKMLLVAAFVAKGTKKNSHCTKMNLNKKLKESVTKGIVF